MVKLISVCYELMVRCCYSLLLVERVQNVFNIFFGEGSICVDSQLMDEVSCQIMIVFIGSSQGVRCNNRGWVDFVIMVFLVLCYFMWNKFVGDCFFLQMQVLWLWDGWYCDVKQGEQQFFDLVCFFQMWIVGKDKVIDIQCGVFIDFFGNGGGIVYQCGFGVVVC